MRPEIKDFAKAMETKMSQHDSVRRDEWKNKSVDWLVNRLLDEYDEAMECYGDKQSFCAEMVDIANFAMMIFYKVKENR
jgi:hypothetical protein